MFLVALVSLGLDLLARAGCFLFVGMVEVLMFTV